MTGYLPSTTGIETGPRSGLFSARTFGFVLGAIIAAFFYDVLFGLRTFVIRDYSVFAYPLAEYHRASFWHGEIPLWNPFSNCGLPFLAQWSTLTLYPPSLIYLLLPLPWSLSFFSLLHLWFAGMGMYVLARRWTGSDWAGAVAGLAFALNGFTLNCLMWPAFLAAIAWMPWIFQAVLFPAHSRTPALLWPAAAGTMQMMTGAPEVILLTWGPLALFWCAGLVRRTDGSTKPSWRFLAIISLVALLSAAQLLPFLDFLRHSQRSAAFADATWSMPAWGWANFLVPLFRFYRAPNGVYFQTGQDWTSSYYFGIVALFLALLGLRKLRDGRALILLALSILCLLLALGDNSFLYPLFRKVLPQLGFMRFPIKFVVLPIFAFPLLAGFGAKMIEEWSGKSADSLVRLAVSIGAVLAGGTAAILWFAHGHLLSNENWNALWPNGLSRLVLLGVALATLWALRHEKYRTFAPALLLALLPIDTLTHAPSQNPTVSPSAYTPGTTSARMNPPPALGISRAMMTRPTHDQLYGRMLPDPYTDYLGRRLGLFGNTSLLDRIPNVDGFFSLYLPEPREVWARLFFPGGPIENSPLADFLSIAQYSHPTQFLEWQVRSNAMPTITLGQKPLFLSEADTLAAIASADFNPREVVYLPEASRPLVTATRRTPGSIEGVSVQPHRIEAATEAQDTALVVLSQAYYHPWKASVDGRPVPLWRANYGFQALEVPGGRHVLLLKYEDRAFRIGSVISVLTLAACAGAGWRARTRTAG